MRFTSLYCLTLLAVVSASPIAIPEAKDNDPFSHLRVGLPGAVNRRSVQELGSTQGKWEPISVPNHPYFLPVQPTPGQPVRRPCAGAAGFKSRFREKSIEISNMFRQTLGMPLIKVKVEKIPIRPDVVMHHDGKSTPHPRPYRTSNGNLVVPGTPPSWTKAGISPSAQADAGMVIKVYGEHRNGGRFRHQGFHHRVGGPFMFRLHHALMSLGPWEGRAVAFVLGCGIGVLIRMMWVLAVVAYRAVKGTNEDESGDERYWRLNEDVLDAEEIFVAPPQYFVDEKAPVAEEGKN